MTKRQISQFRKSGALTQMETFQLAMALHDLKSDTYELTVDEFADQMSEKLCATVTADDISAALQLAGITGPIFSTVENRLVELAKRVAVLENAVKGNVTQ